jgi:ParB family chromosome partitioning protein
MTRQTVTHLSVGDLTAHPGNVREGLGDLDGLALSIREHGILQPLTVTEHADGGYLLLAGHRRLAAARMAGLTRVPVIIRHDVTDDDEQVILMLVENTQRRDLNPIEKAEAYGALRNRGLRQVDIARRVGVSPGTVSHYLALLDLPEEERDEIREGHRTAAEGRALVQKRREAERGPATPRPVGRPKGKKTPPHFGDTHRLARTVRGICDHRGKPKVGGVGCGECWELAIRADATGPTPVRAYDVDEAVVESILGGDWAAEANPAERAEVLRRWHAAGKPLAEMERLTGWKPERYFVEERAS